MKCPSSNPRSAAALSGVGQLVSSQCLLACVGSGADTTDLCVENRHSLSRQICVITRAGEQSRNHHGKHRIQNLPPFWENSNNSFKLKISSCMHLVQLECFIWVSTLDSTTKYNLYFVVKKPIPKRQGRQLSLEINFPPHPTVFPLKKYLLEQLLVCKGTLCYWRFSCDV